MWCCVLLGEWKEALSSPIREQKIRKRLESHNPLSELVSSHLVLSHLVPVWPSLPDGTKLETSTWTLGEIFRAELWQVDNLQRQVEKSTGPSHLEPTHSLPGLLEDYSEIPWLGKIDSGLTASE